MRTQVRKTLAAIAAILLMTSMVLAQNGKADDKDVQEAAERARDAASAFTEIMGDADKAIPRELLDRAEAVAVFPGVIKAAFIIGGRGGEGLISRRTPQGWSAPAFFKLGGGSIGAQIGADKTDYIMLFLNDGGLRGLLEDKFEFGADAGIAAGPIGREASATTNATLNAGILSYSRSKGAFIGAALKGSRIAPNNEVNRALYNQTAREILGSDVVTPLPETIKVFPNTLSRYSTRARKSGATQTIRQRTSDGQTVSNTAAANENNNVIIVGNAPPTNDSSAATTPRTDGNGNNSELNSNNDNTQSRIANPNATTSATPTTTAATGTNAASSNINNSSSNNQYAVARSVNRPTTRLAREIRSELLELPFYDVFDWLEFEITSDNAVILRGFVTRPTTKSSAENVVKDVEGIATVRNEIEVLPASSSDGDLRVALYRAVYSGPLFRYGVGASQPIHIIVNRGRVTLKGIVDNEADRDYAGVQANGVSGVFEVRNDLIVAGREEPRR